jgi:hypothetical protein
MYIGEVELNPLLNFPKLFPHGVSLEMCLLRHLKAVGKVAKDSGTEADLWTTDNSSGIDAVEVGQRGCDQGTIYFSPSHPLLSIVRIKNRPRDNWKPVYLRS